MTEKKRSLHINRYLVSGVITVIPLWVTWLVFELVLRELSSFGRPWVRVLSRTLQGTSPSVARWLLEPWFQNVLAVSLIVVGLYFIGWAATRVIGRRLLRIFDLTVARIPVIETVYGLVKKLITALQRKPDGVQRVVLIDFPSPEMKAVGFVTRTMRDTETGAELAAVYVPTTPNPTSGYLEIVPVEKLVSTDWSMDAAMNFIISGGAVAPGDVTFERGFRSDEESGRS